MHAPTVVPYAIRREPKRFIADAEQPVEVAYPGAPRRASPPVTRAEDSQNAKVVQGRLEARDVRCRA
jgi:hypothetical protein